MKNAFIIDESTLISAFTGVDERGREDQSAVALLTLIVENCHSLLCGPELFKRWTQHANLGSRMLIGPVFGLLNQVFRNSEKLPFNQNPASLPADVQVPDEDDRHLLELCYESTSPIRLHILVTLDNRLRTRLAETNSGNAVPYVVVRPSEALEYAQNV